MNSQELLDAVSALGTELRRASFPLSTPGAEAARAAQREIAGQIDDYLIPRLSQLDAPLLVVIGGSTGSGKSTIVNSLIGRTVSTAGVLRPTTTTPILVSHPEEVGWFEGDRILPGMPRSTGKLEPGSGGLHLVADADVPRGMAFLDAPDIDSIVSANREMAAQLLGAADLWLFVTTASRYADAVPWSYLRRARERSTALALVLNRVPQEALEEVPHHLEEMLRKEGLAGTPVLTIPEAALADGLIPAVALQPVRGWLDDLAADAGAKAQTILKTLTGALDSLPGRVEEVARQLEAQMAAADELAGDARRIYSLALQEAEELLAGGSLLRSEVLARWHEFLGTGDVMRSLQSTLGRLRDRVRDVVTGRPPVAQEVQTEVERSIETVAVSAADKAAERTLAAWRSSPQGEALIAAGVAPDRSSPGFAAALDAEIRTWQAGVLQLVKEQGPARRATGRAVSFGVNAVGAALMLLVFAHSGGLTGGELVIAGGTAALSQRLLEALFGEEAVRTLAARARNDLLKRLAALMDSEAERFARAARREVPPAEQVSQLRSALAAVQAARP
ncbi:MAG TPA: GTPase domain-containing protein [Actinomycetota bacterium]|nr:GTPase domain-containing protein [Actinomycetota bacterium]